MSLFFIVPNQDLGYLNKLLYWLHWKSQPSLIKKDSKYHMEIL